MRVFCLHMLRERELCVCVCVCVLCVCAFAVCLSVAHACVVCSNNLFCFNYFFLLLLLFYFLFILFFCARCGRVQVFCLRMLRERELCYVRLLCVRLLCA